MASSGTCPRGHELAEDAVYCTVCWVRVEPIDPEVVAARRRRQRRIWIPLFGAGAVALGVLVGGSLGSGSGTGSAIVAAEQPPVATAVPSTVASAAPDATASDAPAPSSAAEPVAVTAPLAATVAEPLVRTLTACVPADTGAIVLKGRSSTDDPWVEQAADVTIGAQGGCAAGEVEASISSGTDATRWRLVLQDGSGERIGKDTVDAPTG